MLNGRTGNRFREIEAFGVACLAEIWGGEQLLKTHDACTPARGLSDGALMAREGGFLVCSSRKLDQPDAKSLVRHCPAIVGNRRKL